MALTIKQEKFCQSYVEVGNASEAYRLAYNADNMKPETIHTKAKEMLRKGPIRARIGELNKKVEERHGLTIDSLLKELEEARTAALTAETVQASAAVTATMSKAKIVGFDKTIVEQTNFNVNANVPLSSLFGDNNDED